MMKLLLLLAFAIVLIAGVCIGASTRQGKAQTQPVEVSSPTSYESNAYSREALAAWLGIQPGDILTVSITTRGCKVVMQRALDQAQQERLRGWLVSIGCATKRR